MLLIGSSQARRGVLARRRCEDHAAAGSVDDVANRLRDGALADKGPAAEQRPRAAANRPGKIKVGSTEKAMIALDRA